MMSYNPKEEIKSELFDELTDILGGRITTKELKKEGW